MKGYAMELRIISLVLVAVSCAWGKTYYVDQNHANASDQNQGTAVQASWSGSWDSIYVAGNRIYGCNEGIVAGGYDWLVENNEVERLLYPEAGDCDYARFFGERITFRNNYFHGARSGDIATSHVDGFQTFDNNGEVARDIGLMDDLFRTWARNRLPRR